MAILRRQEGMQQPHRHLTFGETSVCPSLYAHLVGEKLQEDLTTHVFVGLLMGKPHLNPLMPWIQVSRSPGQAAGQAPGCQAGALLHTVPGRKNKQPGLIPYLKYWWC